MKRRPTSHKLAIRGLNCCAVEVLITTPTSTMHVLRSHSARTACGTGCHARSKDKERKGTVQRKAIGRVEPGEQGQVVLLLRQALIPSCKAWGRASLIISASCEQSQCGSQNTFSTGTRHLCVDLHASGLSARYLASCVLHGSRRDFKVYKTKRFPALRVAREPCSISRPEREASCSAG